MPSSFIDSIPPIMKFLIDLQPTRVIDVGPGWGKYGLMCREYLPGLEQLWAVEVTPGRLSTQDVIYDKVFECDARDFSTAGWPWTEADIILFIDVIEHMTRPEGHRLLNAMINSGARVLLSTPKTFIEQHDEDNPYETHRSLWSWRTLQPHGVERDLSTIDSIIYVLKRWGSP
jgi:hypothetical protein